MTRHLPDERAKPAPPVRPAARAPLELLELLAPPVRLELLEQRVRLELADR